VLDLPEELEFLRQVGETGAVPDLRRPLGQPWDHTSTIARAARWDSLLGRTARRVWQRWPLRDAFRSVQRVMTGDSSLAATRRSGLIRLGRTLGRRGSVTCGGTDDCGHFVRRWGPLIYQLCFSRGMAAALGPLTAPMAGTMCRRTQVPLRSNQQGAIITPSSGAEYR